MSELNERSKRQIALLAGDDLEGSAAGEARRSIETCPECRGHWLRVRGCLHLMERVGKESSAPVDRASLWPALESRLARPVVRRAERFNGWVPALSMAAACIALMVAGQLEAPPQDSADAGFPAGRPVTSPMLSLIGSRHGDVQPTAPGMFGKVTTKPSVQQEEMRGLVFPYDAPLPTSPFGGAPR